MTDTMEIIALTFVDAITLPDGGLADHIDKREHDGLRIEHQPSELRYVLHWPMNDKGVWWTSFVLTSNISSILRRRT